MKTKYTAIAAALLVLFSGCTREETAGMQAAGVVDGEVVDIMPLTGGTVVTVNFQEGGRVEQGRVLMEVDARKLKLRMEELDIKSRELQVKRGKLLDKRDFLESTLAYWTEQVARLERLAEKQSVAGDELRKAELKKEEIESSLDEIQKSLAEIALGQETIANQKQQLELNLEDFTVLSPVNGVVLARIISQGETTAPMKPAAEILDLDSLFVETFVEEKDLSRLSLGQRVDIMVDGRTSPVSGRITVFGREAEFSPKYIISEEERKSLLYRVKIEPEDGKDILKLGMPVTVVFNGLDTE
jgi:HlyD family secretion protein